MKRVLCLLLWLPLAVFAARGEHPPPSDGDKFLIARDAYRNGDAPRLAKMAAALRKHDLAPWLDYWSLRLRLDGDEPTASTTAVHDFLDRQAGSYLAEKLRGDWLRALGKRGLWAAFAADYPPLLQPDADITCYGLQARLDEQHDASAMDEARPLWFSLSELSEACRPLLRELREAGRISDDDVWLRLRGNLEARKLDQARATATFLALAERPDANVLEAVAERPQRHLDRLPEDFAEQRTGRELALFAVARLARQDPQSAAAALAGIEDKLAAERGYAWGQVALAGAQRHRPEATGWFAQAGATPLSDEQRAWKVRAALRAADWPGVLRSIEQMPSALAAQPAWIYWRGRALTAAGRGEEAAALYAGLADLTNFYGNLAAAELGQPITVPPKAAPPSDEELAGAATNPGLRRALALFRLDLRVEGVREWNWALRDMDDRRLLAAAQLARRAEIFDRSISAADRTLVEHDFSLRFPAPYRDQVGPRARRLALDDGWVYGLMRQESRFVVAAKSSAGAKGLMQLMPATAHWVAKKIGLAGYHPQRVAETEVNLTLGVNYLRMVLDSLDNDPVLASAAYNAGPGRARQWRGDKPLEAAIYIETIPFTETRDYVKKVLSNTVYYAALFEDKPQSIKTRLGTIAARSGGAEALAEALP